MHLVANDMADIYGVRDMGEIVTRVKLIKRKYSQEEIEEAYKKIADWGLIK